MHIEGNLRQKHKAYIILSWKLPPNLLSDLPWYEKQICRCVPWPIIMELQGMQQSQQQPIEHGTRSLMFMKGYSITNILTAAGAKPGIFHWGAKVKKTSKKIINFNDKIHNKNY